MTEQNAQAYEEALRHGGVAIGVTPRNDDHASETAEHPVPQSIPRAIQDLVNLVAC